MAPEDGSSDTKRAGRSIAWTIAVLVLVAAIVSVGVAVTWAWFGNIAAVMDLQS